jgi:hypothetical protein
VVTCNRFTRRATENGAVEQMSDLPLHRFTRSTQTTACPRVQSFFSASSRNSSGMDRDSPNMTDPYPTASQPKRSLIRSIARSAVQRAIGVFVAMELIARVAFFLFDDVTKGLQSRTTEYAGSVGTVG